MWRVCRWLSCTRLLKSKNEACVEGYGSTIERHASKLRGNQEQENYSAEAFLHINGPLLLHDADHLIDDGRCVNMHFGKDKKGGNAEVVALNLHGRLSDQERACAE